MHTQFTTGKRFEGRKRTKREEQYLDAMVLAHVESDSSQIPQTIWLTNDRDAPYMSLANGSTFKAELKPKPVVSILPRGYFNG